jgi:cytochrome c biogenesis protein CcmG/thiol:disulfide interchange protein DsbE
VVQRWAGRLRGTRRGWKLALTVAALAALTAGISVAVSSPGQTARALPLAKDFTLPTLDHPGQGVSLTRLSGRPVIVNFFASWCVPCKEETPLIARFYRSEDGRVAIIGVDSSDQASAALRFTHAAGVSYPVGFDPSSGTASEYGVIAIPQTFFLNARHRIVRRIFGAVTNAELTAGAALVSGRASGHLKT